MYIYMFKPYTKENNKFWFLPVPEKVTLIHKKTIEPGEGYELLG